MFPNLPDRTRLFRQFAAHPDWTRCFLADPTIRGVADSYGIEWIHPMREGRREKQIGQKGKSHHRWLVGSKLGFVLNKFALMGECDIAKVHDATFRELKVCPRGTCGW